METFLGLATIFLGIIVINVLFGTFFIWIGARMAKVKNITFGKCVLTAIGAALVTNLIGWVFASFAGILTIIGWLIGLFLSVLVIKAVFKLAWGKGFLVWIFHVFAELIAVVVIVLIFGGALFAIVL